MNCEACGIAINLATDRHAQHVEGWVIKIAAKPKLDVATYTDRYACGTCLDSFARNNSTWQQPGLFDNQTTLDV